MPQVDYLPNPAARALSTSRSMTIAAIIPTTEHSIFSKCVAAIERTLAKSGFSLVLAVSNADDEDELNAAQVAGDGSASSHLSGPLHSPVLAGLFARRNVPYVFTSVWEVGNKVPTIGYDNAALANRAIEYLASEGHRNIAVLHGPLNESDRVRARRQGASKASRADLNLSFFETSLNVASGRDGTERMLKSAPDTTAALCFSEVLALGCYLGLQNAGLSVPGDVSLMGFDNLDWSASVLPALTTIDLPTGPMGENVASQLVCRLEHDTAIVPTSMDAVIVERPSVCRLIT